MFVVMAYQPPTDLRLRDPEFNKKTEMSIVPATQIRASTGPPTSSVASTSKRSLETSPPRPTKKVATVSSTSSRQPLQPIRVPPNTGKEGRSQCPICQKKPNCSLRHHALQHLPWYGDPIKVCWECGEHFTQHGNLRKHLANYHPNGRFHNHTSRWVTLLSNFFHVVARSLQLSTIEDLLPYVIKHHLFPNPGEPNPDDKEMMRLFDVTSCRTVPAHPYHYSPPNSVAALTHWKIMVLLVEQLDVSSKHHLFKMPFSAVTYAMGFPAPTPGIPSIFEINPVPVPCTRVATTTSSGPSQDHNSQSLVATTPSGPPQDQPSSSLVAGVPKGPLQEPHPSSATACSSGPPQDCHVQSVQCPPQDKPQTSVSSSGPSRTLGQFWPPLQHPSPWLQQHCPHLWPLPALTVILFCQMDNGQPTGVLMLTSTLIN